MKLTTLEQSKKLKEMCAPQDTGWFWVSPTPHYGNPDWRLIECGDTHANENIAAYDLESLIEWLGKNFGRLSLIPGTDGINTWEATYWKNESRELNYTGATPLEAVYSLAEAIHGKEGNVL